jgi:hypothetical protein
MVLFTEGLGVKNPSQTCWICEARVVATELRAYPLTKSLMDVRKDGGTPSRFVNNSAPGTVKVAVV